MTTRDLLALVDYHYWARDRMLSAVEPLTAEQFTRDLGNSFRSVRDTLAHLQAAELIWLSRFLDRPAPAGLSPDRFADLAAVRAGMAETERDLRAFVNGLDDDGAERMMEYRLMNGQPSRSRVWCTVQHVVNHGSYHRGQVTTMLRQLGAPSPQSMDLIAFYRERDA